MTPTLPKRMFKDKHAQLKSKTREKIDRSSSVHLQLGLGLGIVLPGKTFIQMATFQGTQHSTRKEKKNCDTYIYMHEHN